MAINASYGHGQVLREEGIYPPKPIRSDVTITVTNNNRRYDVPAWEHPGPKNVAAQRAILHRSFKDGSGGIDLYA